MPQQLARIFALALLILAGVMTLHCNTSLLHAQSTEICANGIDDDGDSLIDCDDPDCTFQLFFADSYGNSSSNDVALGDLDGDGDLDAWVTNTNSQPNRVWINQGGDQGGTPGTYVDSGQALGISSSINVALGDLDGDGDLDAWVTNGGSAFTSNANRVWINQGGDQGGTPGTYFDSGQALGNSSSMEVALDDLDGDGDLDAWVANYDQANRIWINQGGDQGGIPGTYVDSGQALGNSNSTDVALGDLDGDGDLDAWVAISDSQPNRVWINQGGDQGGTPGTYANSSQTLGSSNSAGVALGDLDGDGDLDAWVANAGIGEANRVWINEGGYQLGTPGKYVDSGQALDNSESNDVSLGDLDGDGDLDAWVANWDNQANRVWINLIACFNDEDGDGIPNACDIDQTAGNDCDADGQDDSCQPDTDSDGTIDPCDDDLDNDGIPNECDPDHASGDDCNSNGILDSCDIAGGATDADSNGIPDECEETPFIRGDVNGDGRVDISDAITTLDYLFTGGSITCDKAADSNDDAAINVADAIQLLGYLFSGTGDLSTPFPTCGVDPTADSLECEIFGGCP